MLAEEFFKTIGDPDLLLEALEEIGSYKTQLMAHGSLAWLPKTLDQ